MKNYSKMTADPVQVASAGVPMSTFVNADSVEGFFY